MPRWNSCNIFQLSPDASRLWQFEAKGNFKLNREVRAAGDLPVPAKLVSKSWSSFWQPRLNVAWLPPESVFLRVIEVPRSTFEETVSMVELQLEKLSPMPVTQIVWTIRVLPQETGDLQTVVVVIAGRSAVEEFLGKLEGRKFLADRLETPALDQLEAITTTENGAWICPAAAGGTNAALVAWWYGGVLRNISFVMLPAEGDQAAALKSQLAQLTWAGELEGWLNAKPAWHLVAEGATAAQWEAVLQKALEEPVQVAPPLNGADLAARTARRATQASQTSPLAGLLPAEFSNRYREQFRDRLWLHGLYTAGVAYLAFVAFYFGMVQWRGYQCAQVQQQVADLADSYTNAMQLQAKYGLLQTRENLKFAALDCLKLTAENLPAGLTLQRFGFGEGQTLTLYGTAKSDQLDPLDKFCSAMQKAKLNGQDMFTLNGGEPLSYHIYQDNVDWNFSLQLKNGEKPQ
jgi:hypothetical protein